MEDSSSRGRLGEAAAVKYFLENGYEVFHPMFGNTSCDLIVLKDGCPQRVEVKSTTQLKGVGYMVELRRFRKSDSYKFDSSKSDILAVYIQPYDEIHIFPSREMQGRSTLSVRPHSG